MCLPIFSDPGCYRLWLWFQILKCSFWPFLFCPFAFKRKGKRFRLLKAVLFWGLWVFVLWLVFFFLFVEFQRRQAAYKFAQVLKVWNAMFSHTGKVSGCCCFSKDKWPADSKEKETSANLASFLSLYVISLYLYKLLYNICERKLEYTFS